MANKMKTFVRNKTVAEIRHQCEQSGVMLRTKRYESGDDHISLVSEAGPRTKATVLFNTFNGRFFGTTPDGTQFSSDDKRDGTPWFDALLDFFYATTPAECAV